MDKRARGKRLPKPSEFFSEGNCRGVASVPSYYDRCVLANLFVTLLTPVEVPRRMPLSLSARTFAIED